MKRTKASQADVAKKAGVSQAVVSVVLNDSSAITVSEETRQRVLAAADELDYGRMSSLGRRDGKIIAFICNPVRRGGHREEWIFASYERFYQRILDSLVRYASGHGFFLLVKPCDPDTDMKKWLRSSGVGGVIWHGRDEELFRWIRGQMPIVELNRLYGYDIDTVTANQEEIIHLAMEHLYSRGHRQIAYLPLTPRRDGLWKVRQRTYDEFVADRGLYAYTEFNQWEEDGTTMATEAVYGLWREMGKKRPTAIVVGDHRALLLIKYFQSMGVAIPKELSFVGIDDVEACQYITPALTSISQPLEEIAEVAFDLLRKRMETPSRSCRAIMISPRLMERDSVASIPVIPTVNSLEETSVKKQNGPLSIPEIQP